MSVAFRSMLAPSGKAALIQLQLQRDGTSMLQSNPAGLLVAAFESQQLTTTLSQHPRRQHMPGITRAGSARDEPPRDYIQMAFEYRDSAAYRAAARGEVVLSCCICNFDGAESRYGEEVTHAFLPCAHACACNGCITGAGRRGGIPLTHCPVCMESICAVAIIGPDIGLRAAEVWAEVIGAHASAPVSARFAALFARTGKLLRKMTDHHHGCHHHS